MILIDTSVWVEYFRQNEPIASEVSDLLAEQRVITIESVFSELMYGVRNIREKNVIQTFWKVLPRAEFEEEFLFETSSFSFQNDYQDKDISLMDAVTIRAAKKGGYLLWTLKKSIISNMDSSSLFRSGDDFN